MSRFPIIKVLLAFCTGILVYEYLDIYPPYPWVWVVLLTILCTLLGSGSGIWKRVSNLSVLFTLVILGVIWTASRDAFRGEEVHPGEHMGVFQWEEPPKPYKRGFRIVGEFQLGDTLRIPALLYFLDTGGIPNGHPGTRMWVKVRLNLPKPPRNPEQFDFQRYLRYQGIRYVGYVNQEDWLLLESHEWGIRRWASQLRQGCMGILAMGIHDERALQVGEALLLGYRQDISDEVRRSFSDSGTLHILAVSGLHVGVIFLVLQFLLSPLTRRVRLYVIISILWFYALFTGWSPSVVRAATMFSMIMIGQTMGRETHTLQTVLGSALILLVLDPFLLFSLGFQLSYSAVIAIITLQPWLSASMLSWSPWMPQKFIDLVSVSIAAQIGTLPISLLHFHQFPTYFLLANILVVPIIPIVIYGGWIALVLAFATSWSFFLVPLEKVLQLILIIVRIISQLPGSMIRDIPFSSWVAFGMVLSGMALFRGWKLRKPSLWIFGWILLTLLSLAGGMQEIVSKRETRFTVYSTYRGYIIAVDRGRSGWLFGDSVGFKTVGEVARSDLLNRGIPKPDTLLVSGFLEVEKVRFWIPVSGVELCLSKSFDPQVIILNFPPDPKVDVSDLKGNMILLHAGLKPWEKQRWVKALNSQGITPIDLTDHGISFTQSIRP